jgi:hypothetical protein
MLEALNNDGTYKIQEFLVPHRSTHFAIITYSVVDSAATALQGCTFDCENVKMKTCRTILLPVLYGCKIWSLKLREEHMLGVLETRQLRKTFWAKMEEATEVR